jgi:hypothetical protein
MESRLDWPETWYEHDDRRRSVRCCPMHMSYVHSLCALFVPSFFSPVLHVILILLIVTKSIVSNPKWSHWRSTSKGILAIDWNE